jgi:hypothetical protein
MSVPACTRERIDVTQRIELRILAKRTDLNRNKEEEKKVLKTHDFNILDDRPPRYDSCKSDYITDYSNAYISGLFCIFAVVLCCSLITASE